MLLLAQLPPPVHGVSTVTAEVARATRGLPGWHVIQIWSGSARSVRDIGRLRLGKVMGLARVLAQTISRPLARARAEIAYTTLAPHGDALLRDALIVAAARIAARRVLVHLHTCGLEDILEGGTARMRLIRTMISGTELVTPTAATAAAATRSRRFRAVHHIDNFAPAPAPQDVQREPSRSMTCAFMGHIDPRKGALRFVDAVEHLRGRGLPIEARVAGAPSRFYSADEFRRHLAEHAPCIDYLGFVEGARKSEFLAGTDVFVYLSNHDFAPLVLIEAMAHGAVPIAFDVGAVADILGDEFRDHVIPADAPPDQWKSRILDIVAAYAADPEALARDKRRAQARFLQKFTLDRFAATWTGIVEAGASVATGGAAECTRPAHRKGEQGA